MCFQSNLCFCFLKHLHIWLEPLLDPPAVRAEPLQVLHLLIVTAHHHPGPRPGRQLLASMETYRRIFSSEKVWEEFKHGLNSKFIMHTILQKYSLTVK